QHTSTLCTPSAEYFAVVPAPLEASSSGWACTCSRVRRSSVTRSTLPAAFERPDLCRADAADVDHPVFDEAPTRGGGFGDLVAHARRDEHLARACELGQATRKVDDGPEVVTVARDHRSRGEPDAQLRQCRGAGPVS